MSFYIDDSELQLDKTSEESFVVRSFPHPYDVVFDTNPVYKTINRELSDNPNNSLVIDKIVYRLHGKKIRWPKEKILPVPASEDFKSLKGVTAIVDFLQKNKFTKAEKLVVVGGGVTQDVSGFVSAIFKRGMRWVLFPTTLLAMSDSCIGGKVGINYKKAKNQLALFYSASKVIINLEFLKTLTDKDTKCGLGEIIKLHLTGGRELFERYKELIRMGIPSYQTSISEGAAACYPLVAPDKRSRQEDTWLASSTFGSINDGFSVNVYNVYKELLFNSLLVKKAVIEKDEFEKDIRKALNYGHTVGHAIESETNYRIPHGQAIAIGMIVANEIATRRNILPEKIKRSIEPFLYDLIDKKMLEEVKGVDVKKLFLVMTKDKKALGSVVQFVILRQLGEIIFLPVRLDEKFMIEVEEIIKLKF